MNPADANALVAVAVEAGKRQVIECRMAFMLDRDDVLHLKRRLRCHFR